MPDEEDLEEFEEKLKKIEGSRFFDPNIDGEGIYQKLGRRAQNKERARSVLNKYSGFKQDRLIQKKKKRLLKQLQIDDSTIASELYNGLDEEEDDDVTSTNTSQKSIKSDMDTFDVIKRF